MPSRNMQPMNYQEQPAEYVPSHQTTTMQTRPDARTVEMRLETSSILDEIQNMLKGLVYDVDKGIWTKPAGGGDPLIKSERGVIDFVRILKIYLNTNMFLSEFNEEEISLKMMNFTDFLIKHLMFNAETYCDNNTDTLSEIHEIISTAVYTAMKRAKNRGESKAISDVAYAERVEYPKAKSNWIPRLH